MTAAPAFVTSGRSATSDLQALCRPVPPLVEEAAGEIAVQHRALAERFGQTTSRLIAARRKLEDAQLEDDRAAREALVNGEPIPKPKADKARADVEQAERELRLVSELIPESARKLLAAAVEVAAGVDEQASAEADASERRALSLLADARDAFADADSLLAQAAWSAELLAGEGMIRPFAGGARASAGAIAVETSIREIEQEQQRRGERTAERDREIESLNVVRAAGPDAVPRRLPPPPARADVA